MPEKKFEYVVELRCGSGRSICTKPPTESAHSCPYQADVNGNHEEECHCCEDCESECSADI